MRKSPTFTCQLFLSLFSFLCLSLLARTTMGKEEGGGGENNASNPPVPPSTRINRNETGEKVAKTSSGNNLGTITGYSQVLCKQGINPVKQTCEIGRPCPLDLYCNQGLCSCPGESKVYSMVQCACKIKAGGYDCGHNGDCIDGAQCFHPYRCLHHHHLGWARTDCFNGPTECHCCRGRKGGQGDGYCEFHEGCERAGGMKDWGDSDDGGRVEKPSFRTGIVMATLFLFVG